MNHAVTYPERAAFKLVARLWHGLAARWATRREKTRKAHEFDFTTEMSLDTLRDIGAPDRIIAAAAARREGSQLSLSEMRQWRDG